MTNISFLKIITNKNNVEKDIEIQPFNNKV